MRYAITVELMRLGHDYSTIKDILIDWNERNERCLGPGDQKRQLLKYVDWVAKKQKKRDCKVGCKALSDFCLGKERCQFHQRVTRTNREITAVLPFDVDELEKYLNERYGGEGRTMMQIVRSIIRFQNEKATGEIIFISFRNIRSRVRDYFNVILDLMHISRDINKLEDEGIIKTVRKGKQGSASCLANEYRFLSWPAQKES